MRGRGGCATRASEDERASDAGGCSEQCTLQRGRWQQRAIDRRSWRTFRTARGGVRSLWLATSRGSDRGCGSEGGRPDAPDCTTPPFSPRPFPTHGPFRVQTLTNLTLISQTSPPRDLTLDSPASTLLQPHRRRHCSPRGDWRTRAHTASHPLCKCS